MANEHLSRRHFLATVATTGAVATTQHRLFASTTSLAEEGNPSLFTTRSTNEPIKIVCTMNLSPAEAQ